MSDYFLNKIYESLLQNKPFKDKNFKTLAESYNTVYEQETEQQITPVIKKNLKRERKLSGPINSTPDYINSVLSKALADKQITQIEPIGDYSLDNLKILPEDMPAYKILFAKSPPTAAGVDNSKNSGKGELALFWLLSKKNNVQDTRGGSSPDLTVNGLGVEVKSVSSGWVSLGRFAVQKANLKLLSILFGLDMILNVSNKNERPPSLEDFDKDQLIKAFESVSKLDNIQELRAMSPTYVPIQTLYSQLDFLLRELNLISGKVDVSEGSARILLKILTEKLLLKPGVTPDKPGYIANCFVDGNIHLYTITQEKINNLTSKDSVEKVLNNIKASSPNLQMQFQNLFA